MGNFTFGKKKGANFNTRITFTQVYMVHAAHSLKSICDFGDKQELQELRVQKDATINVCSVYQCQ